MSVAPIAHGGDDRGRWRLALLTFVVVVLYGSWHYRWELFEAPIQSDVAGYLRTFDRVQRGLDPYGEPGYLYSPAFAFAGNALYRAFDPAAFLIAYRVVSLLALWLLVWMSLRPLRWAPWAQAVAALLVVHSELAWNGIHCANATVLLAGPLLAALLASERRPIAAGLLAGSINAWKPLGAAALVTTALPWRRVRPARAQLLATGAEALAIAGWLLVGWRYLPQMLRRADGIPEQGHHLSVQRALFQLGVHVSGLTLFVSMVALAAVIASRWGRTHAQRVAIGLAFSALAVPVVNPNTLLLALPAQAMAIDLAAARWRATSPRSRARRAALGELAVVGAMVVGVHGALGSVAMPGLPFPWGGVVTAIPLLEVAGLVLYAVLRREPLLAAGGVPAAPVGVAAARCSPAT